ncbi:MAG: alpha/beta fold hydrolase [Chloroflexi bacterium]|nr:alpha/beta fold hydrolase [Chloroflexota bacterium]
MVKTITGYTDLDDGKLYYEMAGDGDTLVLGHAGFVDGRMWDAQWDAFAQKYRVIRFDMRGYGKSDPAHGPRNRCDDLFQLLDHLHVERAVLLGCSMGGTIMLDFVLEHPEMASALITVSSAPSGFQLQGDPQPEVFEMITASQQGETARTSELQIRIWVDGPYRQPEQVNPRVRQHAAEMNLLPVRMNTWLIADAQPLNPLDPPAIGRLGTIHVPTLIMAGALDHPEVLRAADVMTAAIKGAKKHVFARSAHVPNMEEPEEFTQVVLNFLDGLK